MGARESGLGRPGWEPADRHTRVTRLMYMKCRIEGSLFRMGLGKMIPFFRTEEFFAGERGTAYLSARASPPEGHEVKIEGYHSINFY
jgi:hypothetical protein